MMVSLAFAALLSSSAPSTPELSPHPHIVLIVADDLGFGDPGCYNPGSRIPTPNIDRLAATGMRFTDVHSPSAVCTPTRYGLLTGRYSWRSRLKQGVLQGYDPLLIEPGRVTIASLLRRHGYRTHAVGKWHLGLGSAKPTDYGTTLIPGPREVGFDAFFGIPASLDMPPYVFVRNHRVERLPGAKIPRSAHRRQGGGGFWRGGSIAPGFRHDEVLPRVTAEAVAVIDRWGTGSSPLFLYVALPAPHTPWLPTPPFRGLSDAGFYGDFVAQVDAAVGQVMAALIRNRLVDRTLLVVTSDNGAHWPRKDIESFGHRANGPWRGQKADIHEGGHRVPFVARWPGHVPEGRVNHQLGCLTDLTATFASIVGAELPADAAEDSFDLWPGLRAAVGDEAPARPEVVHHSLQGMFAIRVGSWKLILGRGSGGFTRPQRIESEPGEAQGQLYDLSVDPGETTNRWLAEPERVRVLTARLQRIRSEGRSRPR